MKITAAGVVRQGVPRLDDRRSYDLGLMKFGDGEAIVITIESEQSAVSKQARGYYFGVVLKHLSKYSGHSIDDLHAWAKAKFTPKHVAILDGNGQVIDDMVVGSTTTTFDPHAFYEYVEELRHFMLERLQIVTPDPDPRWREKREQAA